ncbi:hypothetical protein CEXT_379381 [Caerostris extrusa]|uniref:Uncharacterized protein n=1 Tax=Caerostris extrusa TaxID=172846 RepID=A0AAV4YBD9_CAEEX|nr:hypothetical protein CEXT_379381 [Caerostris extrusa]
MNPFPGPYIPLPLPYCAEEVSRVRRVPSKGLSFFFFSFLFFFFLMSSSLYIFQVGRYNGHAIVKEGPSGKRFQGEKRAGKGIFLCKFKEMVCFGRLRWIVDIELEK